MCDDLEELVEEKVEEALEDRDARIEELEQELEEERERRRALEERLEEREALVEDRTPSDAEGTNLTDVWIAGNPAGKILEKVQQRSAENAERLEEGQQGQPDAADDLGADAPPIYDVLRCPESSLGPTERRTRFLWADLADYASRTPKGYVLPASDARRVLEAAEPEDSDADRITSKHVGRVFELSVDLTREAAFVRKKGRERQLVVPTNWEEEARAAAPDAVVS